MTILCVNLQKQFGFKRAVWIRRNIYSVVIQQCRANEISGHIFTANDFLT